MSTTTSTAADLFRSTFGAEPTGLWSAPGRVNLIGEHTDYNDGLVLPFAIDSRAHLAASVRTDDTVRVVSAQRRDPDGGLPVMEFDLADLVPGSPAAQQWSGYLLGVLWTLRQDGHQVGGLDIALDSTVPVGAGLSSSAALECVTTLAASDLFGLGLSKDRIARIAQRTENDFVGVPCGLMDQMASSACTAGNALFFDVQATTVTQVPFDPESVGLAVMVVDTRVHHQLADGEYAKRRRSCEEAAAKLGVPSLRHIDIDGLDAAIAVLADDVLIRRTRHIVTENARVAATVELLAAGDMVGIGAHLDASHVSMRDDFEITSVEIDLAVEVAQATGAIGARMTGGGFGGSIIALVRQEDFDTIAAAVVEAFAAADYPVPVIRAMSPAAGALRDA
ncbi:galactokinase [Nakamurella silvestris]|nr:galactokinase [Nakamurella silvestris]